MQTYKIITGLAAMLVIAWSITIVVLLIQDQYTNNFVCLDCYSVVAGKIIKIK